MFNVFRSRAIKKDDEDLLSWDEEDAENYKPDIWENDDVETSEYEDLDRPKVQQTLDGVGSFYNSSCYIHIFIPPNVFFLYLVNF